MGPDRLGLLLRRLGICFKEDPRTHAARREHAPRRIPCGGPRFVPGPCATGAAVRISQLRHSLIVLGHQDQDQCENGTAVCDNAKSAIMVAEKAGTPDGTRTRTFYLSGVLLYE
jgi:hypothetical protein